MLLSLGESSDKENAGKRKPVPMHHFLPAPAMPRYPCHANLVWGTSLTDESVPNFAQGREDGKRECAQAFDPAFRISLSSVVSGHQRVSPCMRMQSHDTSGLPASSNPETPGGKCGGSNAIHTVKVAGALYCNNMGWIPSAEHSLTEQREIRAGRGCSGKGFLLSAKYPIHKVQGTGYGQNWPKRHTTPFE